MDVKRPLPQLFLFFCAGTLQNELVTNDLVTVVLRVQFVLTHAAARIQHDRQCALLCPDLP